MALMYHLVQRPDKSKGAAADAKLYYGQIRAQQTLTFGKLCESIAASSTASQGDVMLVIDGLLAVMKQHLDNGEVVEMGDFGKFRMLAGSRIIFTPGAKLKNLTVKPRFEKIIPITAPTTGGGSGEKPEDL